MTLENLFKIGNLHWEPPDSKEFKGLVLSAQDRLEDAQNSSLSFASRFDLAYNAAHFQPCSRHLPLPKAVFFQGAHTPYPLVFFP